MVIVQLVREDLTWPDWVYFLGFLTPMMTSFILFLANPTQKTFYAKVMWYLGFFTYVLSVLYYIAQSILLILLYVQLSSPPSDPVFTTAAYAPPTASSNDVQSLLGFGSWAHQTYKAMPEGIRANIFASVTINQPA